MKSVPLRFLLMRIRKLPASAMPRVVAPGAGDRNEENRVTRESSAWVGAPSSDEGRAGKPPSGFAMPDREELPPQTASPAHRGADQAKAAGLPDPIAVPDGWRQRSFRDSFSRVFQPTAYRWRLFPRGRSSETARMILAKPIGRTILSRPAIQLPSP